MGPRSKDGTTTHARRMSRRQAVHVLIQAYDVQHRSRRASANIPAGVFAVSLNAAVWEQVVSSLRPLAED